MEELDKSQTILFSMFVILDVEYTLEKIQNGESTWKARFRIMARRIGQASNSYCCWFVVGVFEVDDVGVNGA